MPSSSKKQHNFMAAVANNPSFAKKAGVPQSVGKEFSNADKGRKFSKGGDTMATKMNAGFAAMMEKKKGGMPAALAKHAAKPASKAHKGLKSGGMTGMGAVKTAAPSKDGVATIGKTKGSMVTMKSGGKC
jgi:hypothetical protein